MDTKPPNGAPQIEFIVPFYGDPRYLRETVESIRRQSITQWTATIIDDCYPLERVSDWIDSFSDQRIRVVRNPSNLGANETYRLGVEMAQAEYIVILGADDRLLPNYLERVVAWIEQSAPTVIQPGVRVIDSTGLPTRPVGDRIKSIVRPAPGFYAGERITSTLMRGNWTYFPSLCWQRNAIQEIGFRRFDVVQDLGLLSDVLIGGGTIAVDDVVSFEYRRHESSDSALRSQTGQRFREERRLLNELAMELEDRGWNRAARAAHFRWTTRAHALLAAAQTTKSGNLRGAAELVKVAVLP